MCCINGKLFDNKKWGYDELSYQAYNSYWVNLKDILMIWNWKGRYFEIYLKKKMVDKQRRQL